MNDLNYKAVTHRAFWVQCYQYLYGMTISTYQIENVKAKELFLMVGLEEHFKSSKKAKSQSQLEESSFYFWILQMLNSLDPELATMAWNLQII